MKNQSTSTKSGFHFHWGMGIALSFILFCSFILYIVIRAFQQDIDLVSTTYYLDELAYQDRIEAKANLFASGETLKLRQTDTEVFIQFPARFSDATGDIHFYHPSREIFDQHFTIQMTEINQQRISKAQLLKGNYRVKVKWEVEGTSYYQENLIYLR